MRMYVIYSLWIPWKLCVYFSMVWNAADKKGSDIIRAFLSAVSITINRDFVSSETPMEKIEHMFCSVHWRYVISISGNKRSWHEGTYDIWALSGSCNSNENYICTYNVKVKRNTTKHLYFRQDVTLMTLFIHQT